MDKIFKPSKIAFNTNNSIRIYQEKMSKEYPNHKKSKLMFHIGDPTLNPNFRPHKKALKLFSKSKYFGYSIPNNNLKDFLNKKYSNNLWKLKNDDIIMTCGASNALLILILSLCDEGDVLLCPEPGFPLAKTICDSFGIIYKGYELEINNNWRINLNDVENKICTNTKGILINNPSNPTGSVWPKEEVLKVVKKCEELKLPIISDEVYEGFTFKNHKTCSFGTLNTKVPVFVVNSASKTLFAPGWRIGWILLYGEKESLKDLKTSINKLKNFLDDPDILVMQNLDKIFKIYEEEKYIESRIEICEKSYEYLKSKFFDIKGFKLNECQGGIFGTIGIEIEKFKDFKYISDLTLKLEEEQNLYFLPGNIFGKNNFMRFTNIGENYEMDEMCNRLKEFSLKYYNK